MTKFKFEIGKLVSLLRRSENDPEVRSFFGEKITNITRDEYYGWLEFKADGVDVVFNEAPWVLPSPEIRNPKELYLIAFHLHREGHEGYAEYQGQLPSGVASVILRWKYLAKWGDRKNGAVETCSQF